MVSETDFIVQLGTPFIAHRLRRLSEAFVDGYSKWLPDAGVSVPARSLSTLLLLAELDEAGVTELAARLRLTHPFMIKMVARLNQSGFVELSADPRDARRRPARLTEKGRAEVVAIRRALHVLESAYETVFREIGVDLTAVTLRVEHACLSESFHQRLQQAARDLELEEEEAICEER